MNDDVRFRGLFVGNVAIFLTYHTQLICRNVCKQWSRWILHPAAVRQSIVYHTCCHLVCCFHSMVTRWSGVWSPKRSMPWQGFCFTKKSFPFASVWLHFSFRGMLKQRNISEVHYQLQERSYQWTGKSSPLSVMHDFIWFIIYLCMKEALRQRVSVCFAWKVIQSFFYCSQD